jgi:hypothetical protein
MMFLVSKEVGFQDIRTQLTNHILLLKKLYSKPTDRTPEIKFKYGKLRIWGTFVPVDPAGFCMQLYEWVNKYSNSPATVTIVDIGIKYTRGYAMSYIQKLLQELILLNSARHQVTINWHFATNSIVVKAGEYLSRKLNYPFNFVEVEII